jgi:prepilin-type N-terminal cleavage/methylation domain-containing protein
MAILVSKQTTQPVPVSRAGFTLMEVLVALTLLSVGLLVQAGAATLIIELVDHGRDSGRAGLVAANRLERLRLWSIGPGLPCGHPGISAGGPQTSTGVVETWTAALSAAPFQAEVQVTSHRGRRVIMDTVATALRC